MTAELTCARFEGRSGQTLPVGSQGVGEHVGIAADAGVAEERWNPQQKDALSGKKAK